MRLPLVLSVVVVALPSSAFAYKLQGPAWDTGRGPIRYHLQPDGSDDVEGSADLDEVRGAFELWSCVEGSALRFREGKTPGERIESLTDGMNNVFWDEDNSFALGPATFSVTKTTPFVPDQPAVRDAADIILNGFDHQWTTGTPSDEEHLPIFNVVLREIGVLAGLDVECGNPDDPATCPGADESVMSPYIPGAPRTELLPDDVDAVLALYASDDGSSCTGPFRQGEPCSCNDDCVGGMICAPDGDGENVCSPTCSSEDASCPTGFSCVLAARAEGDEPAAGQCVLLGSSGLSPVAGTCENDRDCEEGLCASIPAVGRTACRVSCESDGDCPTSYACNEGHCTWAGELDGALCELPGDTPPPGCACAVAADEVPKGPLLLGVMLLSLGALRRRRLSRRSVRPSLRGAAS